MTAYKSYAACKISHPDSEVATAKEFSHEFYGIFLVNKKETWQVFEENEFYICNPADYCSSLKEFLDAGFKLVEGDKFIGVNANVITVFNCNASNVINDSDVNRFIISAAAINGGCKIPAKAEQWTIYSNTLPLCELSDEQVGKLVKHSGCVEHMNPNSGEWGATISPMWNRAGVYRIKPKSERELFIEAAMSAGGLRARDGAEDVYGSLFDSGKFKLVIKDGE